jgi:hypothetical protein
VATGVAAILLAPRATAVAALAGLFAGWSVTIDRIPAVPQSEAA